MNLCHVVFREILHRKLGFSLAVLCASVAVACLVAALAILQKYDLRTAQIITAKEAQTRQQMATLEDDYRRLMLKMGFNVLILPKDQNLSDLYADDFASKYMPEEYATRLAASRVATINHILPSLQQKVKWPHFYFSPHLSGAVNLRSRLLAQPIDPHIQKKEGRFFREGGPRRSLG